MYAFLLTILILDGLLLAAVILLQAGQGGGLASFGGGTTDLVVGGRQAATLLTKTTWICASLFMVVALLISLVAPNGSGSSSEVLEQLHQNAPTAEQPAELPLEGLPVAPSPDSTAAPAPATPGQ